MGHEDTPTDAVDVRAPARGSGQAVNSRHASSDDRSGIVRVLIADDDRTVREACRQLLIEPFPAGSLRLSFCAGAEATVTAVCAGLNAGDAFAMVFLDACMPPGPDGVRAAARICELDPAIEIVICGADADVDPGDAAVPVPPEEKLSHLRKPFHPYDIRQRVVSLACKWRAERRLVELAHCDVLTGLPNRAGSRSLLSGALARAGRLHRTLALLHLDLDNFRRVNDTLGHAAGDELLREVASRLRLVVGRDDLLPGQDADAPLQLARLGGDEFMVVLPHIRGPQEAAVAAARLIVEIQRPMQLGSTTVVVTPSIGIATCPAGGPEADELLRNADLAMSAAKRRNAGSYSFFEGSMNAVALHRFTLESELRGALEREEFTLHYQPQFNVSTGSIAGMEALLRWTHPALGRVPPAEFIPVAEETGLILPIGEWVLRTACRQARAWQDQGLGVARMAVNVSGRQFALPGFAAVVAGILEETGIAPSLLELEITESVVVNDTAWAELALRHLKDLGVQLAIDDFGTGYSSFGRLRNFAVDRLKIDRSFIARLIECGDDRAIAAAIIGMSRSLRIQVTAEGVESLPQLLFLQEHHCQEAQGFLFSRAVPAAEAQELLRRATASDQSPTALLRALMS